MINHDEILNRIENSKGFPRLSEEYLDLINSFNGERLLSTGQLIDMLERYPKIAEDIIKSVNSPIFNPVNPVDKLESAVILLGAESVFNIAIKNMILQYFPPRRLPGQKFNIAIFWKHIVAVGLLADEIGKLINYEDRFRLFTYGLMHDLGIIVIDACLPDEMDEIEEMVKKGLNHNLTEKVILSGLTHCDVGEWMCHKWGIGKWLTYICKYHHNPSKCPVQFVELDILSICEIIGERYYSSIMKYTDPVVKPFDNEMLKRLNIKEDQLRDLEKNLPQIVEKFISPYREKIERMEREEQQYSNDVN